MLYACVAHIVSTTLFHGAVCTTVLLRYFDKGYCDELLLVTFFFQPLSMGVPQVCATTLYVSKCASQTSFESADWSCRHSCFCLLPLGLLLLDRSELSEAVHTLPSQFEKHIK